VLDGASLIYTTPNTPSQLPTLIHSSLGVTSLLRRQPLKANTIDRDKIVVPPNWDSWSKIRVLRDGFDVEAVSAAWSADLERPFPTRAAGGENEAPGGADAEQGQLSTVDLYEKSIQDPSRDALALAGRNRHSTKLEVTTDDTQEFLARQLKLLETYRQKKEEAHEKESRERAIRKPGELDSHLAGDGRVNEHIGPVQFNMGGIQVDADDMLERIKVHPSPAAPRRSWLTGAAEPAGVRLVPGANEPGAAGARRRGYAAHRHGEPAGFLFGSDESQAGQGRIGARHGRMVSPFDGGRNQIGSRDTSLRTPRVCSNRRCIMANHCTRGRCRPHRLARQGLDRRVEVELGQSGTSPSIRYPLQRPDSTDRGSRRDVCLLHATKRSRCDERAHAATIEAKYLSCPPHPRLARSLRFRCCMADGAIFEEPNPSWPPR